MAYRKCILHRISLTKVNINASEKKNDFFRKLQKETTSPQLGVSEEELQAIKYAMGSQERGRWYRVLSCCLRR